MTMKDYHELDASHQAAFRLGQRYEQNQARVLNHPDLHPLVEALEEVATDRWRKASLWFRRTPSGTLVVDDLMVRSEHDDDLIEITGSDDPDDFTDPEYSVHPSSFEIYGDWRIVFDSWADSEETP